MTSRYEALEQIQRLHQAGTLSDEEFSAEKQRILAHAYAPEETKKGPDWGILAGAALALVAVVGAGVWMGQSTFQSVNSAENETSFVANSADPVEKSDPSKPSPSQLPEAKQLELAGEVVLGVSGPRIVKTPGETKTTRAHQLLRLPFGPVLLTITEIEDGCHGCAGAIGVHYLAEKEGTFAVVKEWPEAVQGWGWGAPPAEWNVSDKFADYLTIFASGGYTGQGVTCSSATLTELRPEGPIQSDPIPIGYSNGGAVLDETGETSFGDSARELEGKIVKIVRGQSFEVRVTGTETFVESYVRKGSKFVRTSGDTQLGC